MGIQTWQLKQINSPQEKLMFIGESLGLAEPLFNAMLQTIDLKRDSVSFTNEISQITRIKPNLIMALGEHTAHTLLNVKTSLTELRGKIYSFQNIPVIVTYHPAHLLRHPGDKRKAYEDLQKALNLM